jgi:O-antigen ligase
VKITNSKYFDYLPTAIVVIIFTLLFWISDLFIVLAPIGVLVVMVLFLIFIKQPKIGLYLLIFNLPLNYHSSFLGFGGESFSISTNEILILFLIFAVTIRKLLSGDLTFPNTRLNRPIAYLIVFNVVGLLIALVDIATVNYIKCWMYFYLWFEYVFVFFLVVELIKTDQEIKIILNILIVSAMITVISALYQKISGDALNSIGVVSEVGKTYYRLVSSFGFYSNHYGAYLLIVLSIMFNRLFNSVKKSSALIIFIMLTLYTLIFTFSRGAFLGLIMLVILLIRYYKLERKWIIFSIVMFLIFASFLFAPVFMRWENKSIINTGSQLYLEYNIRIRLASWLAALNQFLERPLFGGGFNTFAFRDVNFTSRFGFIDKLKEIDNQYLKILVESGLAGLVAFFCLIKTVYRNGLKCFNSAVEPFTKEIILTTIMAFSCFLVNGLFESTFFVGKVMGILWVLLGLLFIKISEIEICHG